VPVVRLPVLDDDLPQRPRTRADCASVPRPCPWVGCRFNTFLDVDDDGRIRFNGEGDPDERDPRFSCALDVADEGGASLRDVGDLLGFTREAARQLEARSLKRMQRLLGDLGEERAPRTDREPTASRDCRRRVDEHIAREVVDEASAEASDEDERISFFGDDEPAVLDHVWRIYARRIGVSTVSKFSKYASAWRAANPDHPSNIFRFRSTRRTP
jgi:hypothetical protein